MKINALKIVEELLLNFAAVIDNIVGAKTYNLLIKLLVHLIL